MLVNGFFLKKMTWNVGLQQLVKEIFKKLFRQRVQVPLNSKASVGGFGSVSLSPIYFTEVGIK